MNGIGDNDASIPKKKRGEVFQVPANRATDEQV